MCKFHVKTIYRLGGVLAIDRPLENLFSLPFSSSYDRNRTSEISKMHKHGLKAIDRTLQDLRGNKDLMGGLIVVLAGDFRQTLPVIPRGTMADEIKACLKSSYFWKQVKVMKLTTDMRIQNNCQKFLIIYLKLVTGKRQQRKMGKSGFPMNSARYVQH
ncbi:hypothetical protein AVEN_81905-1 [Araneus ventricosus]|uniref:ATP-dependent DNA helicase n=1 Tax=Araneus ventricosus TaxID=182803 RepID=A0A4Y2MI93_ARAVE|nr:hypothetical protein AVEN_81905-1 [Araneus ventricosus]